MKWICPCSTFPGLRGNHETPLGCHWFCRGLLGHPFFFFQTDWGGGWDTSEEHLFPGCALDFQWVLVIAAAPGIFLGKVSFVTLVGLKGARVYVVLRNWWLSCQFHVTGRRKGRRKEYNMRGKKVFLHKQYKEIEEDTRMRKTRDLFKETIDTKILRKGGKNTQKNCTKKMLMTQIVTMTWSLT